MNEFIAFFYPLHSYGKTQPQIGFSINFMPAGFVLFSSLYFLTLVSSRTEMSFPKHCYVVACSVKGNKGLQKPNGKIKMHVLKMLTR